VTRWFAALVVVGAAIRVAALPLPGTNDVAIWKVWSYAAAHEGVGRLYGVGGTPLERRVVSLHGAETTVDYPPLALAELGLAGRAYRLFNHGRYPDDARLIVAVKVPILLADIGVFVLLLVGLRPLAGSERAMWAALVYWFNPAVILDGVALGYLDLQFVLPLVAGLIAAAFASPFAAGAFAGVALLTKPQAIVAVPVIALAIGSLDDGRRASTRVLRAAAGAAIALALGLAPIVVAGGFPNFLQAMSRLRQHDMLSANACNAWWLVGYAIRAAYSTHDLGAWTAWTTPTRILTISRFMEIGFPNPRLIGVALTGIAFAWGGWTARRARDLWAFAALAAFCIHAYATLSAQVHENHLFAAVPLLVVASAGRPAFRPIALVLTAIVALNLNLFYGISEDLGYALPRAWTIIDATVWLALVNCCALAWHARVLGRECSTAVVRHQAPAPA
jgi:hypothetical protein